MLQTQELYSKVLPTDSDGAWEPSCLAMASRWRECRWVLQLLPWAGQTEDIRSTADGKMSDNLAEVYCLSYLSVYILREMQIKLGMMAPTVESVDSEVILPMNTAPSVHRMSNII